MSGYFAADWLALREPVDHAARAGTLLLRLQTWAEARGRLMITDLGAGTGSNTRYLAPALTAEQHWHLVDHDGGLLKQAEHSLANTGGANGQTVRITTRQAHLTDPAALLRDHPDLVTASALLDLVSEPWLLELAQACYQAKASVLFALSYAGSIQWSPTDPQDEPIRLAVNAHQKRDKGFGPALGPDAAACAARVFRSQGYTVQLADSPWRMGPDQAALQAALVDGWLAAASEQQPDQALHFKAWATRRTNAIQRGTIQLTVGHQDLFATPPSRDTGLSR